jgi:hypothetical protein
MIKDQLGRDDGILKEGESLTYTCEKANINSSETITVKVK